MPIPLIAGNWKMNGLKASIAEIQLLKGASAKGVDLLICPPFTLVQSFVNEVAASGIAIGGQDCHWKESGAHTGDISAAMLKDIGATFVIVGHSERRADHEETNEIVLSKAEAAHRAGLVAIICVGETLAQRDDGQTLEVISKQLEGSLPGGADAGNSVIAYEPVWAIGTGRTPTVDQVAEVHAHIAARVPSGVRILYGGSVKPDNAAELLGVAHVDGALVGGASLKAADFLAIASAAAVAEDA